VAAYALCGGAPAVAIALTLLARGDLPLKNVVTLDAAILLAWLGFAFAARDRVVRALQTIGNLVGAVRDGEYSLRGRDGGGDDALDSAMREINALGSTLREQRLAAMEASALLDAVTRAIDVAVFTFDRERRLCLVNPAGARLLEPRATPHVGAHARDLGLEPLLEGAAPRTLDSLPSVGRGSWELRRSTFRLRGLPHELVVLSDVQRVLREEERLAWQRLVRVLGHEINNSLAPIQTIAAHLGDVLGRAERPADWEQDFDTGLSVIARRAEALGRFTGGYAALARLPRPRFAPLDVGGWVRRVVALETRADVHVEAGPDAALSADADQLEQLLINLVKNAVEAAAETHGAVSVTWSRARGGVEVLVRDEGPGISRTDNLFVPFFTTKPTGTGIGLVLARQIAEAHGGSLVLEPRAGGPGCVARLWLPRAA
jgi:nitrogen fixation/metabolism regulation signal transduction histidine kinase